MAKVLPVDFGNPEARTAAVLSIRTALNSGGVIAFPTDTFYGLGADALDAKAVSRIFQIKQRPLHKPLLVLVHSIHQVSALTDKVTPLTKFLMTQFWPGPLTLLLKAGPGLPRELTAGTGKVGIRLPAHLFTLQLLEALGCPLTATSANLSGGEELSTAWDVERVLGAQLDLIVDGGPTPGGKLSTVLDATTDPPTVIREGAVSRAELGSVLPIEEG